MSGNSGFADSAFLTVARLSAWSRLVNRAPSCAATLLIFLCGLKIDLFKHLVLLPTGSCQNSAAVFHHIRMPAQIPGGIFRPQSPNIGVFANQIVDAPGFPAPAWVFPR